MAKPYIHAQSSSKKYGGIPEDYLKIHDFFDSSKAHFPDNRHRAILHTSFGIYIAEQVFGTYITNSDGKKVQVRDIGEQHILEDFGMKFIPTVSDYLENMELQDWMQNGKGCPSSHVKIMEKRKQSRKNTIEEDERPFDIMVD